jgi:hypothetical protein
MTVGFLRPDPMRKKMSISRFATSGFSRPCGSQDCPSAPRNRNWSTASQYSPPARRHAGASSVTRSAQRQHVEKCLRHGLALDGHCGSGDCPDGTIFNPTQLSGGFRSALRQRQRCRYSKRRSESTPSCITGRIESERADGLERQRSRQRSRTWADWWRRSRSRKRSARRRCIMLRHACDPMFGCAFTPLFRTPEAGCNREEFGHN